MNIIAVDDDEHILTMYERLLSQFGTVSSYNNPSKAIDAILEDNAPCDLLIVDKQMPDIDGVDFIHRVRSIRKIETMMVSGCEVDEDKVCHVKVFNKPFSIDRFVNHVRSIHTRNPEEISKHHIGLMNIAIP